MAPGVTLAVALSCTGVALFVGACVAGSTAFTVAMGERQLCGCCQTLCRLFVGVCFAFTAATSELQT